MVSAEQASAATAADEITPEVAWSLFQHVEDQINRSDTKAQVVLAADAILLGWFSTQNASLLQAIFNGQAAVAERIASLLVALVFVGLFLSVTCGLVVIWPRATTPEDETLVYFRSIARQRRSEFVAAFLSQSRVEVTRNILAAVHATARIAYRKFRWVSFSIGFLLATLVLWAPLQVIRVAFP